MWLKVFSEKRRTDACVDDEFGVNGFQKRRFLIIVSEGTVTGHRSYAGCKSMFGHLNLPHTPHSAPSAVDSQHRRYYSLSSLQLINC